MNGQALDGLTYTAAIDLLQKATRPTTLELIPQRDCRDGKASGKAIGMEHLCHY